MKYENRRGKLYNLPRLFFLLLIPCLWRGVDKKEKLSFEIVRSCHAELTRKLAEIKSMRNFLFLLGVSASLTGVSERLFCTALSKGEREIVFELIAKSYNFERGFFIESKSTPLPSPPPWGGNNDHVILSRAKYLQQEC